MSEEIRNNMESEEQQIVPLSEEHQEQIARLEMQLEEFQGKYLRLAADYDNFKKRTERQSKEIMLRANETLICGLLPVLDNFSLALSSIQDESVYTGVRMIYDQLLSVLRTEGLEEVQALGCPFDPACHEAVAYAESAEHDENVVTEEIRKGYILGGKVIRPGMVKVNINKEE